MNYIHYMPTSTDILILDRLLELSIMLTKDMDGEFARQGLTLARTHLLWELHLRGPVKQRELAAALDVSPRNVTALVDALVASDHVAREAHPSDRRAFLIMLTSAGREVAQRMAEGRRQLAAHLMNDLPARDRAATARVLEQAVIRLRSETNREGNDHD